ncbi:MAG: hypothetical protein WAZ21_03515 [Candidatus Saccharimonadales bacterium]
MELVALIVGVVLGWFVFIRSVDWLLIIFYYALFSSKKDFKTLYTSADDETTYLFVRDRVKNIESYADYLRLHETALPSSFKRFHRYYRNVVKLLLTRVAPLVLLPTIIFWNRWDLYLLGVSISLFALVAYKTLIKRYRVGYYQRLIVSAVLKDFLKTTKK